MNRGCPYVRGSSILSMHLGLNTGYAAVVFPGVLDAIEHGDDAAVHAEIDKLVAAFTRMIQGINEIREML